MLVVPPTVALFAMTGRPADLAALRWVVACVRGRYAQWNLVVAGVTTAWALAQMGPSAHAAVPLLIEVLRSSSVRQAVTASPPKI